MEQHNELDKGGWFREGLMQWHRQQNRRSMPWKGLKEPYRIWLSEIILQQTRVEQGLPYYERFVEAYPTVQHLAAAPEEEVFRHWQGLGYYSRARNLHHTARYIANNLGGVFPNTYEDLLALKGVGAYTAAAIASFAFGLPRAVVDGNVVRVLARFCGIGLSSQSTEGKKHFAGTAQALLDPADPGGYNQAIMDHGATICTPQTPACGRCPVRHRCTALAEGTIASLPLKTKKAPLRQRYFHYLLLHRADGSVWIRRRTEDIWAGLYEPLLVEAAGPLDRCALLDHPTLGEAALPQEIESEGSLIHLLTHQRVDVRFFSAAVGDGTQLRLPADGRWVARAELARHAFPRPLVLFFENKFYF